MQDRTGRRYGRVAMLLHWIIAALVLTNLALGLILEVLHGIDRGGAIRLHKSIGVTVLLLSLVRIAWRLTHKPGAPSVITRFEGLARAVHGAFYGLMLLLPLSGWAMISLATPLRQTLVWGLAPWPAISALAGLPPAPKTALHAAAGQTHLWLAVLMAGLVVLHVAGALRHSLRGEDGGVRTMLS